MASIVASRPYEGPGVMPQKYLHNFEPHLRDPQTLCGGLAQLYYRLGKQTATVTEILAQKPDEIANILKEAQRRSKGVKALHAIVEVGSPSATELHDREVIAPGITVAMISDGRKHRPTPHVPVNIQVEPLNTKKYLGLIPEMAGVMNQTLIEAYKRKLVPLESVRDISTCADELRYYASHLDLDLAWAAFRKNPDISKMRTVGFSMCTKKPDDLQDTLGIGVFALFEPGLESTWKELLSRAQNRLHDKNIPIQITTWKSFVGHYEKQGLVKGREYETRRIL